MAEERNERDIYVESVREREILYQGKGNNNTFDFDLHPFLSPTYIIDPMQLFTNHNWRHCVIPIFLRL